MCVTASEEWRDLEEGFETVIPERRLVNDTLAVELSEIRCDAIRLQLSAYTMSFNAQWSSFNTHIVVQHLQSRFNPWRITCGERAGEVSDNVRLMSVNRNMLIQLQR